MLNKILDRIMPLTMLSLVAINAVLLATLLYVILPSFDISFPYDKIAVRSQAIAKITKPDAMIIWKIDLGQNTREMYQVFTSDSADSRIANEFIAAASKQPFTKILSLEAVKALIGGTPMCEITSAAQHRALATQHFRDKYRVAQVCHFPILNAQHMLVGYMSLVWKTQLSQETEDSAVAYVSGALKGY